MTSHPYLAAYARHRTDAEHAYTLYTALCDGNPPPRVPGMDTVTRLAWRIECGRSAEDAAMREYLYRWNLALRSALAFGAPHTIGA